ncbi:MAG: family 43 glycosylhydrolase, partial [Lachnospiraceae bacterium]|nr:family 43 glycosylhydrolase [Lachnospiraceae bacterium]
DAGNRWAFDCHVLMCDSDDPYTGHWTEKGKFQALPEDTFSFTGFSLDMTYFEASGRSYVIWAQHNEEKISCLYLGEVKPSEPWKLISMPMLLTKPEYDWEKVRYAVNEGPAVLQHAGKILVCFSASGTGPEYCVGALEADLTSNLLCPTSWKKYDEPLLTSADLTDEYGPGHNSFTKDENGNDVFVYHARSKECFLGICGYAGNDPLYDPCRHARLHTVTWAADGMPVLR